MSLNPADPPIELTDRQTAYVFLQELDGMIESTEEFIHDDQVTPHNDEEGRFQDLIALIHVRELYTNVFQPVGD